MRRTSGFKGMSASKTNAWGAFCFGLAGRGMLYMVYQKGPNQTRPDGGLTDISGSFSAT
jgi:hypothetical protein